MSARPMCWRSRAGTRAAKLLFEELAGLVEIDVERDGSGTPIGATIAAPQPLSLGPRSRSRRSPPAPGCSRPTFAWRHTGPWRRRSATRSSLRKSRLPPCRRATPDFASFRQAVEQTPTLNGRLGLYLYAHAGRGPSRHACSRRWAARSRMLRPAAPRGPLGALLLSLSDAPELRLDIHQGVVMGRPSLLRVVARRTADGIRATIAGQCVTVLRGIAQL